MVRNDVPRFRTVHPVHGQRDLPSVDVLLRQPPDDLGRHGVRPVAGRARADGKPLLGELRGGFQKIRQCEPPGPVTLQQVLPSPGATGDRHGVRRVLQVVDAVGAVLLEPIEGQPLGGPAAPVDRRDLLRRGLVVQGEHVTAQPARVGFRHREDRRHSDRGLRGVRSPPKEIEADRRRQRLVRRDAPVPADDARSTDRIPNDVRSLVLPDRSAFSGVVCGGGGVVELLQDAPPHGFGFLGGSRRDGKPIGHLFGWRAALLCFFVVCVCGGGVRYVVASASGGAVLLLSCERNEPMNRAERG
mmetsp:Transcript_7510/g.18478  ORF Transcript_7510/g.18478 Transcript_7510/m.18478 type:complete len:301 (+) Transcript_7510:1211-2113(+)